MKINKVGAVWTALALGLAAFWNFIAALLYLLLFMCEVKWLTIIKVMIEVIPCLCGILSLLAGIYFLFLLITDYLGQRDNK